jgi:cobalamin transport system substrate-binding protein
MRRLYAFANLLILVLVAAACAPALSSGQSPAPSAAPTSYPVTVTDDAGRSVTFASPPQRIISFTPGHTETLYALGVGSRVLVTDKFSDYPPENRPKAKLTTYPKADLEELVSLHPDLILVLTQGDDFLRQMEARGIPALKLLPRTFEATLGEIELIGSVVGARERAQALSADMRARAMVVRAKTQAAAPVRVFYELDGSDPTKPFAAGPSGFFGDLVPLAGGANVFADLGRPSGQVSTEQVVARDPDVIILGDADLPYQPQTPELVKARAGWGGISAVKTGRVYALSHALLERPGPRLVEGLERLAKLLHPELFR